MEGATDRAEGGSPKKTATLPDQKGVAGCILDCVGMQRDANGNSRYSVLGGSTDVQPSLRSEAHMSELQSPCNLVCRLLLEKKKKHKSIRSIYHKARTYTLSHLTREIG